MYFTVQNLCLGGLSIHESYIFHTDLGLDWKSFEILRADTDSSALPSPAEDRKGESHTVEHNAGIPHL